MVTVTKRKTQKEVVKPCSEAYFMADRILRHYERVEHIPPPAALPTLMAQPGRLGNGLSVSLHVYRGRVVQNTVTGGLSIRITINRAPFDVNTNSWVCRLPRNLRPETRREKIAILYQKALDKHMLNTHLAKLWAVFNVAKLTGEEREAFNTYAASVGRPFALVDMKLEDAYFWHRILRKLALEKAEAQKRYKIELEMAVEREREELRKNAKSYVYSYEGGKYVLKQGPASTVMGASSGGTFTFVMSERAELKETGKVDIAAFIAQIQDKIEADLSTNMPGYTVELVGDLAPAPPTPPALPTTLHVEHVEHGQGGVYVHPDAPRISDFGAQPPHLILRGDRGDIAVIDEQLHEDENPRRPFFGANLNEAFAPQLPEVPPEYLFDNDELSDEDYDEDEDGDDDA